MEDGSNRAKFGGGNGVELENGGQYRLTPNTADSFISQCCSGQDLAGLNFKTITREHENLRNSEQKSIEYLELPVKTTAATQG